MIARVDIRIAASQSCSGVDLILPIVLEGIDASLRADGGRRFAYHVRSSLKVEPAARSHDEQMVYIAIGWPTSVTLAKGRDIYGRILSFLALRTELPIDSLILVVSRVPDQTPRTALGGQTWLAPEAEAPARCAASDMR